MTAGQRYAVLAITGLAMQFGGVVMAFHVSPWFFIGGYALGIPLAIWGLWHCPRTWSELMRKRETTGRKYPR